MLTAQIYSGRPHQNDNGDVTENVIVDYSTDLTEMADSVRSSIVTVVTRANGLNHTCSGIIFADEPDGVYVFTSDSIIYDEGETAVYFDSAASSAAEVIGTDAATGTALLRIQPEFDVTVMKTAASEIVRQGEYAACMGGRSVLSGSAPISFGIVSRPAQRRVVAGGTWFAEVIDTDAAVSSEMTGGALMNIGGQLAGMILSRNVTGERMATALSANEMKLIYDEFIADGEVTRGTLALTVRNTSDMLAYEKSERNIRLDVTSGVLVTYIAENSSAEELILEGDILLSMDGAEIADAKTLREMLYEHQPGDVVVLSILRGGETAEESVELQ